MISISTLCLHNFFFFFLQLAGSQVKYHVIGIYQQITEILVFSVSQTAFTPHSAYTVSAQSLCIT